MSEHQSPLCLGVVLSREVLTVLTFSCKNFCNLGSLCTCHPDSFLPLPYSSWQSVCQPQCRGHDVRLGCLGLKKEMTKGNKAFLVPPHSSAAGRKQRLCSTCPLSICTPVVSALIAGPLLCSRGKVSCHRVRLLCPHPDLTLLQPSCCCPVVMFSHPITFLVLLPDDGFLPLSFPSVVWSLPTPWCLFVFLVLGQSSSPFL